MIHHSEPCCSGMNCYVICLSVPNNVSGIVQCRYTCLKVVYEKLGQRLMWSVNHTLDSDL